MKALDKTDRANEIWNSIGTASTMFYTFYEIIGKERVVDLQRTILHRLSRVQRENCQHFLNNPHESCDTFNVINNWQAVTDDPNVRRLVNCCRFVDRSFEQQLLNFASRIQLILNNIDEKRSSYFNQANMGIQEIQNKAVTLQTQVTNPSDRTMAFIKRYNFTISQLLDAAENIAFSLRKRYTACYMDMERRLLPMHLRPIIQIIEMVSNFLKMNPKEYHVTQKHEHIGKLLYIIEEQLAAAPSMIDARDQKSNLSPAIKGCIVKVSLKTLHHFTTFVTLLDGKEGFDDGKVYPSDIEGYIDQGD